MQIYKVPFGLIAGLALLCAANTGALAQSSPLIGGGAPFYSYAPAANYTAPLRAPTRKARPRRKSLYDLGNRAFRDGDYKKARRLWKKAAKTGDVFAQWRLANLYRRGQGTKINHELAFSYYKTVARKHRFTNRLTARTRITVDAIVRLAHYYRTGIKKTKIKLRPKRAFALYQLAATHYGHPGAQYSLGSMYVGGVGVKKNTARGMRWYLLAARKHNSTAQAALGDLYWTGKAVSKNKILGLMWYFLARQSARDSAQVEIDERLRGLVAELDDAAQKKARRSAFAWLGKYPRRKQ